MIVSPFDSRFCRLLCSAIPLLSAALVAVVCWPQMLLFSVLLWGLIAVLAWRGWRDCRQRLEVVEAGRELRLWPGVSAERVRPCRLSGLIVWRWLVSVRLCDLQSGRSQWLLFFRDALEEGEFRRLRLKLQDLHTVLD